MYNNTVWIVSQLAENRQKIVKNHIYVKFLSNWSPLGQYVENEGEMWCDYSRRREKIRAATQRKNGKKCSEGLLILQIPSKSTLKSPWLQGFWRFGRASGPAASGEGKPGPGRIRQKQNNRDIQCTKNVRRPFGGAILVFFINGIINLLQVLIICRVLLYLHNYWCYNHLAIEAATVRESIISGFR